MMMKLRNHTKTLRLYPLKKIWIVVVMFIFSCVEPYGGAIGTFKDVLVVNAIITNKSVNQEVTLTRSYRFEEDGPQFETNAIVSVITNDGQEFEFEESVPGIYHSIQPFAAVMQKEYTLTIITSDGKKYASTAMKLPVSSTRIDAVYPERNTNDKGEEGMAIYVDSFDPTGESKYYRHDFVETFKIIAPFWSPYDIVFLAEGYQEDYLSVILREQEERVCYGTHKAQNIVITSTSSLIEDRLKKYNVRFVNRNDYILSYRYSILVKQYVQSPEAFSFYETLRGLSQTSNNVFSEDQPGFLAGNIFSVDNRAENVAGYFEVSAVDEKRIFFNYEDFFPNEELPPYAVGCFAQAPSSSGPMGDRDLTNIVRAGSMRFYGFNPNPTATEGGILMVRPECGDCTTLGSNKVPDFWIE